MKKASYLLILTLFAFVLFSGKTYGRQIVYQDQKANGSFTYYDDGEWVLSGEYRFPKRYLTTYPLVKLTCINNCMPFREEDIGYNGNKPPTANDNFRDCKTLKYADLSGLDNEATTCLIRWFADCENLEEVNFGDLTLPNLTNLLGTFNGCTKLKTIDLSKIRPTRLAYLRGTFRNCKSLEYVDLCGIDLSHILEADLCVEGCDSLKELRFDALGGDNSHYLYDETSAMQFANNCPKLTTIFILGTQTFITKDSGSTGYQYFSGNTSNTSDAFYVKDLTDTVIVYDNKSKGFVNKYNWARDNRNVTLVHIDDYDEYLLDLDYIDATKTKTQYFVNDSLNVDDLVVTAFYINKTSKVITDYTTNVSDIDMATVGEKKLIITYTKKDVTKTKEIKINVIKKLIPDHLVVTKTKTTYEIGDILNVDDLVVTAFYTDGTSEKITNYTTNASSIDMTSEGTKTLTITYTLNGKTVTKDITITVNKKQQPVIPPVTPPAAPITVSSITVTKDKTEYFIGDTINIDDIEVTAKYSDGSTKKVTGYTTNVKDLDTTKTGTQKLIITYKEDGKTVTYTINIVISNIKKDVVLITYMSFDKNGKEYVVPRNLLNMGNGTNNPEEIEIKNKKMTDALANVKVGDKISSDIVNKQNQGGQFKGEIAGGVHTNSKWTKVDKTNNHYEGVIYLTDTKLGKDSIVVILYHKDKTTKNILDKKDLNFGNSRENPERLTIKYTSLPEGYKDTVKTGDKVLSSIINGSDRLGKYVSAISNNCYVDSEWTKVDSTLEEYEAVIYWTLKDNTEKAVTKLVSNTSYMNGYEDNTFKPTSNITREETAAILSRLCDNFTNYNLEDKKTDFTDVKSGSWSEKNIAYISDLGIMKGDGESFNKSSFITRGEFVTAVVRLLGLENTTAQKEFQDAKGSWYSNNANILLSLGIISGDEKGNFNGKKSITRAEICKIINNVLGKSINPNELETKKANNKLTDLKQTAWYYNDVLMATQN